MELNHFVDLYSVSKTLRFRLIPQGKTLENMTRERVLEEDQNRANAYVKMKERIDDYYKDYIERSLSCFAFDNAELQKYADYYYAGDQDGLASIREALCEKVGKHLRGTSEFEKLFKKDLILKLLPERFCDPESEELIAQFKSFTTYFLDFYKNRDNIFASEEKAGSVAFRIVHQNLPKFLDNLRSWQKIAEKLPHEDIEATDREMEGLVGATSEIIFRVESFNLFLSQAGIDRYNQYIGGYTVEGQKKVQGLNEKINLFCQKENEKIPLIKPLFKQILSDRESVSYIPIQFKDDQELLSAIYSFYLETKEKSKKLCDLFARIDQFELSQIYVSNGKNLSEFSSKIYSSWNAIRSAWEDRYEKEHPIGKKQTYDKYKDEENKRFSSIPSFSLAEIDSLMQESAAEQEEKAVVSLSASLSDNIKNAYAIITEAYENISDLLVQCSSYQGKLITDASAIEKIKLYLDAVLDFYHFSAVVEDTGTEADKDNSFYGLFHESFDDIGEIITLYNRVRNYLTQKPYSDKKIKLHFSYPLFLEGWDKNKEYEHGSVILRKDGKYFLGIASKKAGKIWDNVSVDALEACYQKMTYKQIPNAAKYLSKKQINPQNPPDNIKFLLKKKESGETLSTAEEQEMIDYLQNDFLKNYNRLFDDQGIPYFTFQFKQPSEYHSLKDFFRDVDEQAYSIRFDSVPQKYVNSLVSCGDLYLFEIYSKDFSDFSHGAPNLHTLYFKALFEECGKGRVRLQGGGEVFFREKSLSLRDTTIHHKNEPIKNRRSKTYNTFTYDLIKDRRYTIDHFELHCPIKLNFKANNPISLNNMVRYELEAADNPCVIGIDRGERNLLYYSVIDSHGNILEQDTLNVIQNSMTKDGKEFTFETDYHKLLTERGEDRQKQRKEWMKIQGIKELKEGYLSQAVYKICQLVKKYHAVIALENLNSGFKNTRSAVEQSVYQKFEKMLCDKLNYMADKHIDPNAPGGIMNGYQLADAVTSYTDMRGQNGILFYVPAWLTSKIDPTTGFADLIRPKYESMAQAKAFLSLFDKIGYHPEKDYFEFHTDYEKFPKTNADFKKKWIICTFGERIRAYRDPELKNQFRYEDVDLTAEMKKLFERYAIPFEDGSDLIPAITQQTQSEFFKGLIHLLRLTLQMRNSDPGRELDYLISPVRNQAGIFFDSRLADPSLPKDADANGAYNIARKALWIIREIKKTGANEKLPMITQEQWLQYAQEDTPAEEHLGDAKWNTQLQLPI